ncbi:MAG: STN domain-containing protein (plasmid) [Candidatus Manganitrophus sp.]|nr:MAG: STN domain-containing protein [Candidatus Manganitrophus sp.]
MYRARLAQLQEQERQAEHARKLREREATIDVDEKATAPKEGPPRNRSAIQRESGFVEPPFPPEFPKDPSLLEKLNRKIPSLNIIDGEVEFILYDLFKDTGINIISDPGLLKGKKISLRLQDETILNILKYMAENQGFDFAIRDNTLWLTVPKKEQLTTRVFRLKHGLTASRLTRDFESLADLSFLNQATQQQGEREASEGRGPFRRGRGGHHRTEGQYERERDSIGFRALFGKLSEAGRMAGRKPALY